VREVVIHFQCLDQGSQIVLSRTALLVGQEEVLSLTGTLGDHEIRILLAEDGGRGSVHPSVESVHPRGRDWHRPEATIPIRLDMLTREMPHCQKSVAVLTQLPAVDLVVVDAEARGEQTGALEEVAVGEQTSESRAIDLRGAEVVVGSLANLDPQRTVGFRVR
jgi:hypothetical protein